MRVFLHGFAGRALDLSGSSVPDTLDLNLLQKKFLNSFWAPELTISSEYQNLGLVDLARSLNQEIASFQSPIDLVGYSMGARIALHMVLLQPKLFRSLVLISGHFGIEKSFEREKRLEWDECWAQKWQFENYRNTWKEWKTLEVFSNVQNATWGPALCEKRWTDFDEDFLKKRFSNSMHFCGLGRQENLMRFAYTIRIPTWVLAGENDSKFVQQNRLLDEVRNSYIKTHIIKNSGHRVLWDNFNSFYQSLQTFSAKFYDKIFTVC